MRKERINSTIIIGRNPRDWRSKTIILLSANGFCVLAESGFDDNDITYNPPKHYFFAKTNINLHSRLIQLELELHPVEYAYKLYHWL